MRFRMRLNATAHFPQDERGGPAMRHVQLEEEQSLQQGMATIIR